MKQSQDTDDNGNKRMTISLNDTTVKSGEDVEDELRRNLHAVTLVLRAETTTNMYRCLLVEAAMKDILTLREATVLHNLDEFAKSVQCTAIRPAANVAIDGGVPEMEDSKFARARRMEACSTSSGSKNDDHEGNVGGSKTIVRGAAKNEDKRKATTAASFFGASSKSKKAKASVIATKGCDKIGEKKSKLLASSASICLSAGDDKAKRKSSKAQSTKRLSDSANKDEVLKKKRVFLEDSDSDESEEPIVSKVQGSKNNKTSFVGNADDFEGDVDEDEEDEREEQARKLKTDSQRVKKADEARSKRSKAARAAAETRKKRKNEQQVEHENDNNERSGGVEKVVGAMDAFASTKSKLNGTLRDTTSTNGNKVRRQRKKLIEKTTMDKNGYIHTEMVEEMEDIPSDEDEKLKPTRSEVATRKPNPKPKAKKTKEKKQAGLMGFFSKKK